ncbi:DNA-binding domain-containing protein [Sarocladium implicatum]|nr:DNA-binding domain-containing protein [Sarocladium implicatum]
MASQLPAFPRVLFTILEPISFVAGFAGAVADTSWFVQQQVPQKVPVPVTENSIVLAWQLGNIYLLLAFVAVALFTSTSEIKVIRRYLVALALGDVGHIGWTAYGLGMERMSKIGEINLMTWANIAPTIFLLVVRLAYLGGFFGPDNAPVTVSKKRA